MDCNLHITCLFTILVNFLLIFFSLYFQSVTKLRAEGIGTICGRLYVGTAENIPPSELIDTTGAGDAFAGAILYGNRPPLFFIFSFWPLKGHSLSLAIDGALLKHIYGRVPLSSWDMEEGLWFPVNTSWRRREQYSQSGAVGCGCIWVLLRYPITLYSIYMMSLIAFSYLHQLYKRENAMLCC